MNWKGPPWAGNPQRPGRHNREVSQRLLEVDHQRLETLHRSHWRPLSAKPPDELRYRTCVWPLQVVLSLFPSVFTSLYLRDIIPITYSRRPQPTSTESTADQERGDSCGLRDKEPLENQWSQSPCNDSHSWRGDFTYLQSLLHPSPQLRRILQMRKHVQTYLLNNVVSVLQ